MLHMTSCFIWSKKSNSLAYGSETNQQISQIHTSFSVDTYLNQSLGSYWFEESCQTECASPGLLYRLPPRYASMIKETINN